MKLKIFLGLIISSLFVSCFTQPKTNETKSQTNANTQDITPPQSGERGVEFEANDVPLPKAIDVSTQLKDVELSRKIAEMIEKSEFKNARWGVFAVSLKDGRVAVAQDAQKLFNPASTQKLVTTSAALDRLGADFRWRTNILAEREISADGTLEGDLILYGRGAPDFDEPDLANLVAELKQKGLKRIAGGVVGDAGFFRADNLGDGWLWNEAQWYYGAEPSALSYSDNTVLVEVAPNDKLNEPANIKISPSAEFAKITNDTKSVEIAAAKDAVGVHRGLESNEIHVWGEVGRGKAFSARTTMHEPQLWAASELKKSLERNGIIVNGAASERDWRNSKADVSSYKELAFVESDTLGEIVRRTNKQSINLNAELMLRTLGQQTRQSPANQKTTLGDDALGALAIKNWLAEHSISLGESQIHDGSGLSRLDFISPETLGRLLVYAATMKQAEAFKNSLPIAGVDGTLGGRIPAHKGQIFAKTGSITYVNALAGYAVAKSDETFAFVIFCNNATRSANATKTIDDIAALIANYGNESESVGKK